MKVNSLAEVLNSLHYLWPNLLLMAVLTFIIIWHQRNAVDTPEFRKFRTASIIFAVLFAMGLTADVFLGKAQPLKAASANTFGNSLFGNVGTPEPEGRVIGRKPPTNSATLPPGNSATSKGD